MAGILKFPAWISLNNQCLVSGIVMSFWGLWFMIGHVQLSWLIIGGPNYRPFNYLSDFAENWLEGVYMYRDGTCEIISQSDHSFCSYDQTSKCSIYVYHWMRLIKFSVKILTASDTESDYALRCTWVSSLHLYRWEQYMYNRSPERDQYIRAC